LNPSRGLDPDQSLITGQHSITFRIGDSFPRRDLRLAVPLHLA